MGYEFVRSNGEIYKIDKDTLIVYVDETGEETLSDPNYPIFGFGGCVIHGAIFESELLTPWNKMKDRAFGGRQNSLHATDLREPSKEQLVELNSFFESQKIGRFATIITTDTIMNTNRSLIEIGILTMHQRITKIMEYFTFNKVFIVFEDSDRLRELIQKFVTSYEIRFTNTDNPLDSGILPMEFAGMIKNQSEEGLEVADFIVHSAGTSYRSLMNGRISRLTDREDFKKIFCEVDSRLCSFSVVDKIQQY